MGWEEVLGEVHVCQVELCENEMNELYACVVTGVNLARGLSGSR